MALSLCSVVAEHDYHYHCKQHIREMENRFFLENEKRQSTSSSQFNELSLADELKRELLPRGTVWYIWLVGWSIYTLNATKKAFLRGANRCQSIPTIQPVRPGFCFSKWHNFRSEYRNHNLLSVSLYLRQELSIDMFTFSIGCLLQNIDFGPRESPILQKIIGSPFHEYVVCSNIRRISKMSI